MASTYDTVKARRKYNDVVLEAAGRGEAVAPFEEWIVTELAMGSRDASSDDEVDSDDTGGKSDEDEDD